MRTSHQFPIKDMTPTLHAGSCVTAAVPKARRPSHSPAFVRAGGSKQAKFDTNENDSTDQDCSVNPDELHLDHVAAIKRDGLIPPIGESNAVRRWSVRPSHWLAATPLASPAIPSFNCAKRVRTDDELRSLIRADVAKSTVRGDEIERSLLVAWTQSGSEET